MPETIGFLGLGAMGGAMARRLVDAGHDLVVYDPDAGRLGALTAAGARGAAGEAEVVAAAGTVLCSLRTSDQFVTVARERLLPSARAGQVIVNLGTTRAGDTRRLAAEFAAGGVDLLDAPVSGGSGGAQAGTLRIFIGGPRERFQQLKPLLDRLGDPERVVYCGPAGSGQQVKGVNQLAMGLRACAYVEAIAHGLAGGVDLAALNQAVGGGDEPWRCELGRLIEQIAAGRGDLADTKMAELEYFLDDIAECGARLPMTAAVWALCGHAPRDYRDNMARPIASYWHELLRAAGREG